MMHYRKGENVEQELKKEELPFDDCLPQTGKDFLWMKVKGGTKVGNVIDYAKEAFDKGEYRTIVWTSLGGALEKTVACAEIMKRSYSLYQLTRICYVTNEEHWKPQLDGLEELVVSRKVPCLHILLSLDAIDDNIHGVQKPNTTTEFWLNSSAASTSSTSRQGYGTQKRGGQARRPQQNRAKPRRNVQNAQQSPADTGEGAAMNSELSQLEQKPRRSDGHQHQNFGKQRQHDRQQRQNSGQQQRRNGPQRSKDGTQQHGDATPQQHSTSQQGQDVEMQASNSRKPKPQKHRHQVSQPKSEQRSSGSENTKQSVVQTQESMATE